jgi:carbonic anhydrase
MKSNFLKIGSVSVALTASLIISGCSSSEASHHWGYEGEYNPANWGKISPICENGKLQTPINIETKNVVQSADIPELKLTDYKTDVKIKVVNNGHTIKVTPEFKNGSGSYITIDGKKYKLLQFHMHTYSENHIDGKPADLVAHFVHKSTDGELAVVAVFYKTGEENTAISKYWDKMPTKAGDEIEVKNFDVSAMLPKDLSHYFHFIGSLTTPPCSEGVKWFILQDRASLSKEQIEKFRKLYPNNVRPIQELNNRKVFFK